MCVCVCVPVWNDGEGGPGEEQAPVPVEGLEKVRKRYRKQKTKLEEAFPSYLQVRTAARDAGQGCRPGCTVAWCAQYTHNVVECPKGAALGTVHCG